MVISYGRTDGFMSHESLIRDPNDVQVHGRTHHLQGDAKRETDLPLSVKLLFFKELQFSESE